MTILEIYLRDTSSDTADPHHGVRELAWDPRCCHELLCWPLLPEALGGSYLGDRLLWNPMEAAVIVQVLPARQELIQGVLLRAVANVDAGCTSKRQSHVLSAERSSSIQKIRFLIQTHITHFLNLAHQSQVCCSLCCVLSAC